MVADDLDRSLLSLLLHKSPDEVRSIDPTDREQVLSVYRIQRELEAEAINRARSASPNGWPKTYVVD